MNIAEQHYARKLEQLVLQSFRLPDPRVRLASKLLMDVGVGGLMRRVPARGHHCHQLRLCRYGRRRRHWRRCFLVVERHLADAYGLCFRGIRSLVPLPTDITCGKKRERS